MLVQWTVRSLCMAALDPYKGIIVHPLAQFGCYLPLFDGI